MRMKCPTQRAVGAELYSAVNTKHVLVLCNGTDFFLFGANPEYVFLAGKIE